MRQISSAKYHITNSIIWAVMIVACTFAAHVLKEPDMIMFILIAGWVASTGLFSKSAEEAED